MFFCSVLTLSILPFKCQVSAVARTLLKLNAHCGAVFSYSDEQDVHLLAQHCPICLLKVNELGVIMPFR